VHLESEFVVGDRGLGDLPTANDCRSRRLIQKAEGYRATIVNETVTFETGEATGAMPGKLVRGGLDAVAGRGVR
jgi:N-acyl-D-aspartate/D-glutamate deacylase